MTKHRSPGARTAEMLAHSSGAKKSEFKVSADGGAPRGLRGGSALGLSQLLAVLGRDSATPPSRGVLLVCTPMSGFLLFIRTPAVLG